MENEKIVFEIDISSYLKQLEEAGKQVDTLKKKHTELAAAAGSGSAAAAAELQRLNARMAELEKQTSVAGKGLINLNFNLNSSVQVTAAVSNQLNIAGKGANQLNTAMVGAAAGAGQFSQALTTVGNEAEKTEKKQSLLARAWELLKNILKSVAKGINEGLDGVKKLPGTIGNVAQGLQTMGKAFTAATGPVGLVVNLLTGLWDILKGNSEVALEMSAAMAGINKAVDIVIGSVVEFGKGLIDAFSSPEKFIARLMTHLKGLGLMLEGILTFDTTKIFDGWVQGTFGITNASEKVGEFAGQIKTAAEESYTATKQLEALKVATAQLNAEMKKNEQVIDKLNKKLQEKNLGEDERLRIAQQIAGKEIEMLQKVAANKQAAYRAEALLLKDKALTAEQEVKLIELRTAANTAAAEASTAAAQKEMRVNDLLAEHRAQLEEQRLQNIENEREQRRVEIDLMEDSLQKRQLLFDLESEKEEEAMRKSGVKEEEITRWRNKRMKQIAAEYYDEQLDLELQNLKHKEQMQVEEIERTVKDEKERSRKILEVRIGTMQQSIEIAEKMLKADGEFTEKDLQYVERLKSGLKSLQEQLKQGAETGTTVNKSVGISQEALDEAATYLNNISTAVSQISSVISNYYSNRLSEIENTKNAELAAIDASNLSEKQKVQKKGELEKKAAKEKYDLELKQFKANKAMSIIQATVSAAQAVVSALAGPWPASIAFAAIAAATGIAQIALIAQQKPPAPPKFAKGVIGMHGPGTETSDSIPAYLSKGESVITAKATKRFAPVLAQMEMAVGNIPNYNYTGGHFATGVIGDGGFYARESVSNVQSSNAMRDAIAQGFREAPQPVVSVQEITRVNNNVSRSVKVSEL